MSATSPYLQQHADNPVDWWEWGEDAFAEARRRDVPIFLSIGYSACHWCHVMAHESFEDDSAARQLNEAFVSIKVDREERPDIDSIYMDATVAMTGSGGWPMSVFLDHEGRPFFAGTYFPPEPRHGLPSFTQLLAAIEDAWRSRRDEVHAAGERIIAALTERATPPDLRRPDQLADQLADQLVDRLALAEATDVLIGQIDDARGGFTGAPKFPPSMTLEFLIRQAAVCEEPLASRARAAVEVTLAAMARGGMVDQLGGGFARYCVDADWVVPHFEKMLYDNALLLRVYAHWWRLTGDPLAERVTRETAEFLLRDMRTPQGGFAASFDADSDGAEGRFYVWTPEELDTVLGPVDGAWAAGLLSVTATGTFEHGASTLQLRSDPDDPTRWAGIRQLLFEARSSRLAPPRDDKVVTAWNGLAIAALADAGSLLDQPAWIEAAQFAAEMLWSVHRQPDGRLRRTSRDGLVGSSEGVLADYGDLAEGLLALHQATADARHLERAGELLGVVLAHFDDGNGGFYDVADDAPALVRRPRDCADGAEPSGWFAVANALVTFSALTDDLDLRERAERALGIVARARPAALRQFGWGLVAVSALDDGPAVVTLSGTGTEALAAAARRSSAPGAVCRWEPGSGAATAMVCRHLVCQLPTQDPARLGADLTPQRR